MIRNYTLDWFGFLYIGREKGADRQRLTWQMEKIGGVIRIESKQNDGT